MNDFVHLHVHTEFSLLDGLSHIDKLIERALAQDMKSLAVTDHGVMYGIIKFHNQAKAAGLKPIVGVEGYLTLADSMTDRTPGVQKQTRHLLLYVRWKFHQRRNAAATAFPAIPEKGGADFIPIML